MSLDPAPWGAFTGIAEPLVSLSAPLSEQACVLYQLELTRFQRLLLDGFRRRPWRETVGARFLLWSHEMPILVDPHSARLHLPVRCRSRVPAATICERFSRHAAASSLAVRERRVDVGERVHVTGRLTTIIAASGAQATYRSPPTTTLLIAEAIALSEAR